MGSFVPGTKAEQEYMLREAGYKNWDDLFSGIPKDVYLADKPLDIPEGKSELEVTAEMKEIADRNVRFRYILRGAGAYDHYIPSIVGRVVRKESFLTAYTPYQAEISQGILQSIFEYQSEIAALTGMDVSNASAYDGASAAAEGVMMCLDRKRTKILVSDSIAPETMDVVKTYCFGRNVSCTVVPSKEGVTDLDALKEMAGDDTACLLIQSPNYFGIIEPAAEAADLIHGAGAKLVMSVNPISLGLLKTPAEYGADVAVGEGQSLGMPLAWGGPYLGFMAATKEMMRKLPGRIVGETTDSEGRRAYVLTLQAREQHIRREKAGSNICSNEALCALTASVYLAAMGPEGLRQAALQSTSKAHYLQKVLEEKGLKLVYDRPFFDEFLTSSGSRESRDKLLSALEKIGILGGLPCGEDEILWCVTEKVPKEVLDMVGTEVQ